MPTLALTYCPASPSRPGDPIVAGEAALALVFSSATALDDAVEAERVFEGAVGKPSRYYARRTQDAGSRLGSALIGFDLACRRLEHAGLYGEAREFYERKHRRIRAMDRAS